MDKKLFQKSEIGENLKKLISASKYKTQEEFAAAIFVNERTLRRWLRDGFDSIYTAKCCADALDLDIKTILFRE